MDALRWFLLAAVVIVVAVIVYRRFLQTRDQRSQDRRIDVQAQSQPYSSAADISQREERRLAGMTVEDRAWEQASLQRQHHSQEPTRQGEVSAHHSARR